MLGPRGWAGEGEACERGGVVGRGRGGESSLTLGTEKGGQLNCSHPMGSTRPLHPPHPHPHPASHHLRDPKNKDLSALQVEEITG